MSIRSRDPKRAPVVVSGRLMIFSAQALDLTRRGTLDPKGLKDIMHSFGDRRLALHVWPKAGKGVGLWPVKVMRSMLPKQHES